VRWNILDDVTVTAWTYNGNGARPMIRVTEGIACGLSSPTTCRNRRRSTGTASKCQRDGWRPRVTQDPVMPGETFTYEFAAKPAVLSCITRILRAIPR